MLDMLKNQKNKVEDEDDSSNDSRFANLPKNLSKPQMMTASVSIAPIKPGQKKEEENSDASSPSSDRSEIFITCLSCPFLINVLRVLELLFVQFSVYILTF